MLILFLLTIVEFFNATIILQTIDLGLFKAISYTFSRYWQNIISFWNYVF